MQEIKYLLQSWGIINPAEFFFGIGICIGIPLLLVASAFKILFLKEGSSPGRGWQYDFMGLFGCISSTLGLIAVFVVPLFFSPTKAPDWCLMVMSIGTMTGFIGLLILLASVIWGWDSLLKPKGEQEIQWARIFIFYVPICLVFANLLRLYKLFDVK